MPLNKINRCLWACLLFAGSAAAQHKNDGDTLKEVTVTSVKIPLVINTSHPVQVLAGEELQKLNSLSVADALRFFSGVQLKDYGGIGGLKTINVRSMGTHHTAVFYDGLQLGNAQNGQVDLGKFSLDNIDSLSLYSGQHNNIFQPARGFASASSLYIESRRPQFRQGERSHGKLRVKTGSFGLINPAILWQQKISARTSASVSGEWTHAHGRYKYRYTNGVYDTIAVRNNADVQAWRLEAALQGSFKDSSQWSIKAYAYRSARGLPGAIVANHFEYSQRLQDRDMFLQATWNKSFSSRYSLALRTRYTHLFTRYQDPEYNNEAGFLDNRYTQQEGYLSLAQRYHIQPWWEAVLSTDVIINTLDANIYRFAYPTRYTGLAALATRIHFSRVELQASALGTMVDETVQFFTGAGSKRELTPSVSASWQPFAGENFRLRAFYKNIFRMPTFNDLYYTFVGNTNLRPEYTHQYNIGFSYSKTAVGPLVYIAVQADGYYNSVKDKIVAVPAANLFRWTMMNLDRVGVHGIDANIRAGLQFFTSLYWNFGINYTWQQAQDLTPNGYNHGHQIPYTPWHSGSLTTGLTYREWGLHYSFIYTGERYSQKTNIPVNYIEPWYTSDVSLHYKYKAFGISAEVNNLLNQYYDVVLNFPMPGRNYRFSLHYNF
ncbi:TonB-dependent receptor [Chitinophaga sp.]|uniref:TonB-dependent receptor plug domain-containing protein n=1 Tax=Chitinophaga sp. TaxID=1869181 RepID=UPI0031E38D39